MISLERKIEICGGTRKLAADLVEEVLKETLNTSEGEFRDKVKNKMANTTGKAYAFFDCDASKKEIEESRKGKH